MVQRLINEALNASYTEDNGADQLIDACSEGDLKAVKELLNNGADANVKVGGFTPLVIAVKNEDVRLVELLLHMGANPDIKDGKGNVPLLLAAMSSNVKICDELLSYGADVNA